MFYDFLFFFMFVLNADRAFELSGFLEMWQAEP